MTGVPKNWDSYQITVWRNHWRMRRPQSIIHFSEMPSKSQTPLWKVLGGCLRGTLGQTAGAIKFIRWVIKAMDKQAESPQHDRGSEQGSGPSTRDRQHGYASTSLLDRHSRQWCLSVSAREYGCYRSAYSWLSGSFAAPKENLWKCNTEGFLLLLLCCLNTKTSSLEFINTCLVHYVFLWQNVYVCWESQGARPIPWQAPSGPARDQASVSVYWNWTSRLQLRGNQSAGNPQPSAS